MTEPIKLTQIAYCSQCGDRLQAGEVIYQAGRLTFCSSCWECPGAGCGEK